MYKKQKYLLALGSLGALGLVIGLVGGYHWNDMTRSTGRPVVKRTIPTIGVVLTREYARCGHADKTYATMPENQLKSIGRLYRGWNIGGIEEQKLTFKKIEEGLCPTCRSEQFFGIYNEKVAVFYGRPDRRGPVQEVTPLEVKALPDREKEDLNQGLPFRDSKEKLQLLEGLSSLQDG